MSKIPRRRARPVLHVNPDARRRRSAVRAMSPYYDPATHEQANRGKERLQTYTNRSLDELDRRRRAGRFSKAPGWRLNAEEIVRHAIMAVRAAEHATATRSMRQREAVDLADVRDEVWRILDLPTEEQTDALYFLADCIEDVAPTSLDGGRPRNLVLRASVAGAEWISATFGVSFRDAVRVIVGDDAAQLRKIEKYRGVVRAEQKLPKTS